MDQEQIEYYTDLISKMIPKYIVNYEINIDSNNKFYLIINDENSKYNDIKKYFNNLFDILTLTDEDKNDIFRGENALIVATKNYFKECEENNYIIKIKNEAELQLDQHKNYYTINSNICKYQHYLPVFFQKNFYDFKNNKDSRELGYYKFVIENNKYVDNIEMPTNRTRKKSLNKTTTRQKLNSLGCYKNLFFTEDNYYLDNIITKKELNECIVSHDLNSLMKNEPTDKIITQTNSKLGLDTVNNLMMPLYVRSVYRFNQIKEEIKEHLSDNQFINSLGITNPVLKKRLDESLLIDVNSVSKKLYNSYVKKNIDLKINSDELTLQYIKSDNYRFILSENVVFPLTKENKVKCQLKENEEMKGLLLVFKKNTLIYVGQKLENKEFNTICNNMNNTILKYATDFIAIDRISNPNIAENKFKNNNAHTIWKRYIKTKNNMNVERDIKILNNIFIRELITEKAKNILENHKIELEKEEKQKIVNEISNKKTDEKTFNYFKKENFFGFLRRKRKILK